MGSYDWPKKILKYWENEISKKNEIHWHAHIYENFNDNWIFPKSDEFFLNNIEKILDLSIKIILNPHVSELERHT